MQLKATVLYMASQWMPLVSKHVLASSGYSRNVDRLERRGFQMWDDVAARRQDAAWRPIVESAKAGTPREDVVALLDAIGSVAHDGATILEVGCGGGHISEILDDALPGVQYLGLDVSASMINFARATHPSREFVCASAYDLPFADNSFSVVLDGASLIHMRRWQEALGEYARVASEHVVLHALTVSDSVPTTGFAKYAYGQPTEEYLYNRAELTAACAHAGLRLVTVGVGLDYDLRHYVGVRTSSETWVLDANGS